MDGILLIHPSIPITLAAGSIIFLAFSAYYAHPWLAGMMGSYRIQRELNLLRKKGVTVMNHIQLPTQKGEVIHIDHMIITNTQAIIISELGYSGEISGSIRAATWTQETSQGQHRFSNPIRHHEVLKHTISSFLGSRLNIRTISIFTTGHLHITDSKDIIPASRCAEVMHEIIEDVTTTTKQNWATNIIRNITLSDVDSNAEKERTFIANQGNEKHLQIARYMVGSSAALMLFSVALAGTRLAVNQGII